MMVDVVRICGAQHTAEAGNPLRPNRGSGSPHSRTFDSSQQSQNNFQPRGGLSPPMSLKAVRAKQRQAKIHITGAKWRLVVRSTPLDFNYPQGTAPGEYRFTPPFNFAFATHWGKVRPFVLRDAAQFRPGRPYPTGSLRYAIDFLEIKNLGGDRVMTPSARTPAQTEIALFWVESSPLQWNRIARTVSAAKGLTLWENARLFGLLNLALADGYIGSFDTKYHYNYWRPITAIRAAATDSNPFTSADPMWTPLVTPTPIPDYESAHSVEGGAAAQVLKRFFDTDEISFSACSTTLPAGSNCSDPTPVKRSYTSFSQAAEENGLSRILVGFHFRKAVTEGIARGRRIGDRVVNLFLRPID